MSGAVEEQLEQDLRDLWPEWDGDFSELAALVREQHSEALRGPRAERDRVGREWVVHLATGGGAEPGYFREKRTGGLRFVPLEGSWYLSSGPPSTNGEYDRARALLESLSEDDRELIEMLYFDRLTARRAAARLGVSHVAVVKRHRRILRRIKARMGGVEAR